jgi:endonuclease G
MRHVRAIVAGSLVMMAGARSGDRAQAAPVESPVSVAPIVGGKDAAAGAWPDIVAVLFPTVTGDKLGCTGTLIAPTVVLTAGHCVDASDPPLADNVLIGTSSLARPAEGETLAIVRQIAFPDALTTEDMAVLVLAQPSSKPPRPLATGWARFDIANGAPIALVGFGAINKDGDQFIAQLQEASSAITDFDCRSSPGCNTAARPAGELGAGGMGVDTCPGDSGGPLYLVTGHGTFLAGVTSRAYETSVFPCSEGGIYGRPDKVIDWIEAMAGVAVTHGPEPTADPIVTVRRATGSTQIQVNDPASNAHRFAVTTQPAHGIAGVDGDGLVLVCPDEAALGDDQLTVTISDSRNAIRALPLTIKIHVDDGAAAIACTARDVEPEAGGCCDTSGHSGCGFPLAALVLTRVLRRRR